MRRLITESTLLELLRMIADYQDKHGYAPSLREIEEATSAQSTSTASYRLGALEDAGYVKPAPHAVSRAISLTPEGLHAIGRPSCCHTHNCD